MPTKATWAKIAGWGQFIIAYLNEALAANGGVIPSTRPAWVHLLSSLAIAVGMHIASNTSAGHPNGANTLGAPMPPKQ